MKEQIKEKKKVKVDAKNISLLFYLTALYKLVPQKRKINDF